jgi:type VII secretion-associated serine protease mycosin
MLTRILAATAALLAVGSLPAYAAPSGVGQLVRSQELPDLDAVDATGAWASAQGAGVTVAVLDSGVDGTVPDLTGSVTAGPDLIAGIDPPGYTPPHLHATMVASMIAGHGSGPGDAGGIIGVAPRARILSVRVLPDDSEPVASSAGWAGARYANALPDGIRYAVRHGARVINMSLGGPEPSAADEAAIEYAIAHGVVVVASAGNSAKNRGYTAYGYPASYPGVISVAAVDSSGRRASFSDDNSSVLISAPGVHVVGAAPGDQYYIGDGTSFSAAFVSGVVALIRSRYPALSPAQVEQALVRFTTDRPAAGYSTATGFGEVDAVAALTAAGQLARQRTGNTLSPAARFAAHAPGPIQVTHRDEAKVAGYLAAAAAGVLAALAIVVFMAVRRFRRRILAAAASPAPEPVSWLDAAFGEHDL